MPPAPNIDNLTFIRHKLGSLSQKENFQWLTAKETYFKGLLKPVGAGQIFWPQIRVLSANKSRVAIFQQFGLHRRAIYRQQ
jgi:hypothetical protein